MGVTEID
jgi:hypothetical protein